MDDQLRHEPAERSRMLIVGSGPAALEAIIALRSLAEDRVAIELLTPDRYFVYRPMLVAGPFQLGAARRYELARIAADHNVRLTAGSLRAVDPEAHVVHTVAGADIGYDVLLLALGAKIGTTLPGAISPLGSGNAMSIPALLRELEAGSIRQVVFAAPSGVAWQLPLYELALMTSARAARLGLRDVELSLVTPEAEPLE